MGSGPGVRGGVVVFVGFRDLVVRIYFNCDLISSFVDCKDAAHKGVTPTVAVIHDSLIEDGASSFGLSINDFFNSDIGGGSGAIFYNVLDVEADLDSVAVIRFEEASVGELRYWCGAIPLSIPKSNG